MSNQALPQQSRQTIERYYDQCKNLGLILDKYAPWDEQRGQWDLIMRESVRRRGQTSIQALSGGQAKGLWLSTSRQAKQGESTSLFEYPRADMELAQAKQERWVNLIHASGGTGFQIRLSERMAAGLGASHVLETGLTLDRNTGLPYLPGSTVKGLARAWALIEVASQLGIELREGDDSQPLNHLAELLMQGDPIPYDNYPHKADGADVFADYFRFIFGSQVNAGAVCFLDGIYYGHDEPLFATDVMTPHYVDYYTGNGSRPPAEDDNPNPVSFLTVASGNIFAFGIVPREGAFANLRVDKEDILTAARDWLINGLSRLGAGSKTSSGYGFFNRKSSKSI